MGCYRCDKFDLKMLSNEEVRNKTNLNALKASHTLNAPLGFKKTQQRKLIRNDASPVMIDSATILPKTQQKLKPKRTESGDIVLRNISQRDLSQNISSQKEIPLHNITQKQVPFLQNMTMINISQRDGSTSQRDTSQPLLPSKKIVPVQKQPLIKSHQKPIFNNMQKKKQQEPVKLITVADVLNQEQNKKQSFLCYEKLAKQPQKTIAKKIPTPKRIQIIQEPQQKLQHFQKQISQILVNGEIQCMQFLSNRHSFYQIDSTYIDKKQKRMTWLLRAIVIDWMAQICYEYRLKRQTFYLATIVFDNYFQRTANISQSQFQVVGAAAIFITAKLEQYEAVSSQKLCQATCHRYSAEQIKAVELKMCKTLKYYLYAPTTNMWANRIMLQWDLFSEQHNQPQVYDYFQKHTTKQFKKFDIESYRNYRQVMEILDAMTLQIQTVSHKPQVLVLALIYLVLGKQYGFFEINNIVNKFPESVDYMQKDYGGYTGVYEYFLEKLFGMELIDILPSVQFTASFFALEVTYYPPKMPQIKDEQIQAEEYAATMTYSPNILKVVKLRYRGL